MHLACRDLNADQPSVRRLVLCLENPDKPVQFYLKERRQVLVYADLGCLNAEESVLDRVFV